jgi:hypothetical protein
MEWLWMGFELVIGFIEVLQNVTTSNCSAFANWHSLKFTTALIKSFQSAVFTSRCLVTASNAVTSSASVFTPLLVGDCLPPSSQAGGHLAPTSCSSDRFRLTKHLNYLAYNTYCTENIASNSSSIVASRSCSTDWVENTSSHLDNGYVLGICCLTTEVVYKVLT